MLKSASLWTVAVVTGLAWAVVQPAFGDRATAVLDPVDGEARAQLVQLADDDSKAAKKARAAAAKAIRITESEGDSLTDDLADLKKLAGLLGKRFRDVPSMDEAMATALAAGELQVEAGLAATRAILAGVPGAKSAAKATKKATKKADSGDSLLASARQQTVAKKRAALLLRAVKAAVKARKFAEKADPLLPRREFAPAGATGFVVDVDAVAEIVADPDGATPIAGAEVVALRPDGMEVGSAMSGADGGFELADLPLGAVTFEIRLPAAKKIAGTVATTIAGASIRVGTNYTVDRDQATALAMAGVPPTAMVAGTLNPLPAGTSLTPHVNPLTGGAPRASDETVVAAPSWFFFVDLHPFEDYSHAVEYVLVDAETGTVDRLSASSVPMANDAPLWGGYDDLVIYSQDPATIFPPDVPVDLSLAITPDVVQFPPIPGEVVADRHVPIDPAVVAALPAIDLDADPPKDRAQTSAGSAFNNKGNDGVFVVFIRAGSARHHRANVNRLATVFVHEGIPYGNMGVADLTALEEPQIPEGLSALQEAAYRLGTTSGILGRAISRFDDRINARLEQGLHSTLVVYLAGSCLCGNIPIHFEGRPGRWGFSAHELGLARSRACRIRVLIEASHAEVMQRDIATSLAGTQHDVRVFSSSAEGRGAGLNPAWMSYWRPDGLSIGGSWFTTEVSRVLKMEDGDLSGFFVQVGPIPEQIDFVPDVIGLPGQPPDPYVRIDFPPWCFPDEPGNEGFEFPDEQYALLTVGSTTHEFPFQLSAFLGVENATVYDLFLVSSENAENTAGVVVLNLFGSDLPLEEEDGAQAIEFDWGAGLSNDFFKYDPTAGGSQDALFPSGNYEGKAWMERDTSDAPAGQTVELKFFIRLTGSLADANGQNAQSFEYEVSLDTGFFKPPN